MGNDQFRSVVIRDAAGSLAGSRRNRGVSGVRQVDRERLTDRLIHSIALNLDSYRFARLAGVESQSTVSGYIVGSSRCRGWAGGRRGVIDRDNLGAGWRQGDGKRRGSCAAVSLCHRNTVDAQRRTVIILDCSFALPITDGRSADVSNVHPERFIRLDVRVAINGDIKSEGRIAGRNRLRC